MACIEKIYSVSAVLGGPACNAECPGCAGKVLRDSAKEHGNLDSAPRNIVAASRLALNHGAWSLALTSSGEPTLYMNAISNTLITLKNEEIQWPFINLFTNGIKIANDPNMPKYLSRWKDLGLTSIVLSVHNIDDELNRKAYGNPKEFYKLKDIIKIIRDAGLCVRIVLLLGKGNVDSLKEYKRSLDYLHDLGIGLVTSWEIRTNDGKRIAQTPSMWEMFKIRMWLFTRTQSVMGHVWGGMVRNYRGMNIRFTDYVSKHSPWNNYIRQLVVLPDGKVSYSWFQKGMFCLD